ncbi:MAG TPA: dicarboxylate--CoA ligase PimA [Acetobacteraceae bacterium]|nr:dicarboxylate--CoA ligase PimA [Acetobacteraceae bacterium]
MSGGAAPPWQSLYPPGVRWDAPIATGTLPALLDRCAASHGARTAFAFRDVRLSYADLAARADRLAAGLLRADIAAGQSVALYLPNTLWHPICFFAILRTGAWVVHLSPLDPPRALARKLVDSGARTMVTTNLPAVFPNALALLAEGAAERLVVGEDADWGKSADAPLIPDDPRILRAGALDAVPPAGWPAIAAESIAVLQYTGGTTGLPKAAMLSHGNLTAAVAIYTAWDAGMARPLARGERVILVLPLFHIYALTAVMLRGLALGVELLLRPRFDVETTLADIEQRRAVYFPGVPTMWIALVNHPGIETRDLSALHVAGSGGASLPFEVAQRWRGLTGLRLGGGWGMTETCPAGTAIPPEIEFGPGAIGVPLPGIEMDVVSLDDPRRVLPPGDVGEIRIRGPNVFAGYWNRPEETEAAFANGWFLTGDIGTMDARGMFTLLDRKKDMILSGGFNVYPRAIEEAIHEHPSVAEAAVIGIADAYRGQAAKAFVRLRVGAPGFTLEELRDFLGSRLGRHEIPAALEVREDLPRTSVGKLAKLVLIEQEESRTRDQKRS